MIPACVGSTLTVVGKLLISGTGITDARTVDISPTMTPAANQDAVGLYVQPTFTEASSGTHQIFTGTYFATPPVTAGAASVTDAVTVYIASGPTVVGATCLALFVGAGMSRMRDRVIIGDLTTTSDVCRVRGPGDTNFALHVDTAPGQAATYGTWLEANTGVSAGYPILQVTDNGAGATYFRVNTGGTVLVGGTTDDGATPFQVNGAAKVTGQLTSTVTTGTAPLVVASTTKVTNLNADKVDGFDGTTLGRVIAASAASVPHTGDTVETTLATISIPSGTVATGGKLQVYTLWSCTGSVNVKRFKVVLGSSALVNAVTTSNTHVSYIRTVDMFARGRTSEVAPGADLAGGTGLAATATATYSEDLDTTLSLTITGTLANSGETITLEAYSVVVFNP